MAVSSTIGNSNGHQDLRLLKVDGRRPVLQASLSWSDRRCLTISSPDLSRVAPPRHQQYLMLQLKAQLVGDIEHGRGGFGGLLGWDE
jgi:hypothetical protein